MNLNPISSKGLWFSIFRRCFRLFKKEGYAMRILLKMSTGRRYFPWLPGHVSSLLVFVFLFASIGSIGAGVFLWPSAAEAQGSEKGILHRHDPLVREAIEVQHRHLGSLMHVPDVVGTGVGIGLDGLPVIKVFTKKAGVRGIPEWLESVPVHVEVTGMVVALECPQGSTGKCDRPVPIGVSTGHPAITAGTIGARVKDASGRVFALSNNHVYANQNEAAIGDNVLQPGTYDGGVDPADAIGTLYDYEFIDFTFAGENYMDAAIALSSTSNLDNSTLGNGYGIPSSQIAAASIGLPVKKYGRTTSLTHGQVGTIGVFVEVCYEQFWGFCIKSAYFYDQIQISGSGFSGAGDSGSLIVTEDGNNPVGLLFAGSDTTTFANRIDLVLERFGVTIDDGAGTTTDPPVAPTGLTATAASSSQINLAWTDNSNNESGFKIERCQEAGCSNFSQIATVGTNVTTYSNTGLLASTSYTYRVRAYNSAGDSGYSTTASATTLAAPALPAAPSNPVATAVSRSRIDLTWTDNSNNEAGFLCVPEGKSLRIVLCWEFEHIYEPNNQNNFTICQFGCPLHISYCLRKRKI
ncbi:MAG: fibronectin type III domain-containing protein [Planctomycetota bacterium]|nr:fibronectin type III domain-containing protein [Planctomycetota bacterium]